VLPDRLGVVAPAAAVGALLSVPMAAAAFTLLFAIGGTVPVATDKVFVAMVSWHAVIGVGEAIITFLVVGSVVAVRPDLVYGARSALAARRLEVRQASPAVPAAQATPAGDMP
jgi:cobalt/nickel transport system permease protein